MPDIGQPIYTPSASTSISDIDLQSVINRTPVAPTPTTQGQAPIAAKVDIGLNTAIPFSSESNDKYGKPLRVFNEEALKPISGYNEFKSNPNYNPEFSDMQNIRGYAARQGSTEWLANSFAKLGITAKDSFFNAFEQHGRNLQALTSLDPSKLYSTEDGSAKQEELRNLYPTYGTGQLDNSMARFIPWNFGKSDFGGEMLPQLGFTVGTMGATLLENWLVGMATGGVGNAVNAARTASTLGKVGEGLLNLFETANGITNFRKGLNILNTIKNESSLGATIGQGLLKGSKVLANAYAMFNTAGGEAAFEANQAYTDQLSSLKDDFRAKNGFDAFGQDLNNIQDQARKTATSVFGWNIPILLGSNLVQFGNILKPFKGVLAESTEDVAMTLAGKGLGKSVSLAEKEVSTGLRNILGKIGKVGEHLSEPFSEGLEEVSQSVGQNYFGQYYKDLYNGLSPDTALNNSLNSVFQYAGSKSFQDDFFGGFLGGAVFKGVGAISSKTGLQEKMGFETDASVEARKEKLASSAIDILNSTSNEDLIKYLFDPTVQNYVSQVANKERMTRATQLNDRLAFNDAKSQSVRDLIFAGLQTGKLDLALSKLDIFQELDNDELAQVLNIQDKSNIEQAKTTASQLIADVRERADQLESDWNTINKKYKNPYKEGTGPYVAYEQAKKDRLFSKDAVTNDKKRSNNLRADIESTTQGTITSNIIDQAVDDNLRVQAIRDLAVFVKDAPDKSGDDYKMKQVQLGILAQIEKEKTKKDPDFQKIAELTYDLGLSNAKATAATDSIDQINKIKDLLQLEDRNKANVQWWKFLNDQPINEATQQHILAQNTVVDKAKEKAKTTATTGPTTTTTTPTASAVTAEGVSKKLGKGYSIVPTKDGKFQVKFSYKKPSSNATETATLPYDTLEAIDADVANIQKKFPQAPSSTLTEDDLFEASRDQLDDVLEPFRGLTKNPGQIAYTETRPPYENQVINNDPPYMHRIESFLNNLFYKKGRFANKLNLKAVPVTALNYQNVQTALGLPADSLKYIVDQAGNSSTQNIYPITTLLVKELNKKGDNKILQGEDYDNQLQRIERTISSGIKAGESAEDIKVRLSVNGHVFNLGSDTTALVQYIQGRINKTETRPFQEFAKNANPQGSRQFDLSASNINGHITNIYAEQEGDKYYLLDSDGERIISNWENKIVQGRLVTSDTSALGAKIRENTSPEDIKHIEATNKKIREHFVNDNKFQSFDFSFSNGLAKQNNEVSKKVGEVNLIDPKDITSKSIYIPAKKGASIVESPDSYHNLIVGRPYLRIEGKNPDGSLFIQYQELDNTKLTETQVGAVEKALTQLSSLINDAGITDLATTEEYTFLKGVLQIAKGKAPASKRSMSLYLSGKTLKSAFTDSKGVVKYVDTFSAPGIVNAELLDFIKNRYHNVDKSIAGEKFKDFATGKKYSSYNEYLLNSDDAPLTVRTDNSIKDDPNPTAPLPFIQRYSIIDYSPITKEKPIAKTKTYYNPVEVVPRKETKQEPKKESPKSQTGGRVFQSKNAKNKTQQQVEEEVEDFEPASDNFDEIIGEEDESIFTGKRVFNPGANPADDAVEEETQEGTQEKAPKTEGKGLKAFANKSKVFKSKNSKVASKKPVDDIAPVTKPKENKSNGNAAFSDKTKVFGGKNKKSTNKATPSKTTTKSSAKTEVKEVTWANTMVVGNTINYDSYGKKGRSKITQIRSLGAAYEIFLEDGNTLGETKENADDSYLLYQNGKGQKETGRDADKLVTENAETKKGVDEIAAAFSAFNFANGLDEDGLPPFKLEDPSRTEPITDEEIEDVKRMLPQAGFAYNPNLERVFQNRRVWGSYKNGVITLYKGAAKGTAYHEAFETVWNSVLTKTEQEGLANSFRRRVGIFTTFEGINKPYGTATAQEAKEAMADEFLDFKEGRPITQEAPKTFFQKLLSYITDFFNSIFGKTTPSIEDVYRSLDEGVYGAVELRDSTDEYFKLDPNVGALTKYETFESLRSFSAHLFQKILDDNKEILHALDEGQDATKLYDYLKELANNFYFKQNPDGSYDTTSPNIAGMTLFMKQRFQYLQSVESMDPKAAQAQIIQEAQNSYIRWKDDILPNWESFVQSHKNFISGFGIKFVQSFVEEDESLRDSQEKEGGKTTEYTRDVLTTDIKNSVPASIKLLLATLSDSIFISPSRTIDRISDTTGMPTTIVDYKKLFNRMLNHLTGINRPEMIRQKLNDLSTISQNELNTPLAYIRAQFKKVYDGVYNKNLGEATIEDLKLIAKFTSSVSKQKPQFMRIKINSQSGGSYIVNELFEGDLRKFEKNTLDGIKAAQFLNRKKNFWLKWNSGDFKIASKLLPGAITRTENISKVLSERLPLLGITQFSKERIDALDEVSTQKLLYNYNEAIHFLSENKKSIKAKELSLYALGIQRPVQNIGLLFAEVEFDEADPMHLNATGEQQQNIIDNNWPSLVLSDASNFETKEEFVNAHPYYKDVFVKHSLLLDKLFEEKDLNKRLNKLTILSGVEKDGNGKTMSSATQPELFMARLNAGLESSQRKAIFSLLENADGNIDWGIQVGNYVNTSQVYNGELKDILFNYLLDELATALEFIQDGDSPKKNNAELNTTIKGFDRKKGASLQLFINILPRETVNTLHEFIDGIKGEGDAHELIAAAIGQVDSIKDVVYDSFMKNLVAAQVARDITYLQREGYIKKNKGDNYTFFQLDDNLNKKEGFTLQEIRNLLTLRKVNYSLHNIEMFKVFFGAPYFYKDPMKRFKSFISPALTTINSEEFDTALERIFNEGIDKKDEAYHSVTNSFSFYSVPDIKTYNDHLSSVNSAYDQNESTDAQMSMRLRYFKELFWKSGAKWTDDQEKELQMHEAYERQKRKSYTYTSPALEAKDLALLEPYKKGNDYELPALAFINIIKPIQRGFADSASAIPSLLKTSIYPMTYYSVRGTKMEKIYEDLVRTNTAAFGYSSAHKVGQPKSSNVINPNGELSDLDTIAQREEVPFWTMGIQMETQSQKDLSTAGTQIMKIITVDLYDAGVPHDFDPENEDLLDRLDKWNELSEEEKLENESYRLEQNHFKALNELFDLNYAEFLKDWGITETKNPDTKQAEFSYENKDKLYDKIEKYLTRNGVPDNVLNQLQKDENGNIPLELMADYKLVKYIIYSMVDKGVLSPKLHGGQKIQMSSALLDSLDNTYEIWYRTSKKDKYKKREEGEEVPEGADYVISNTALKFYAQGAEGNPTSRMEVLLSSRMLTKINEFREKRKLPVISQEKLLHWLNQDDNKELLEGIGFRIPTQEMASIDAFTIKGFLPESMGDAIAVPSELPTKAGSDFDVDKLNTYLNNYRLNSKGMPEYIKYFDSREDFDDYYSQVFITELEDRIKDIDGRVVRTADFLKIVQDVVFGLADQDTIDHYTPIIREKMGIEEDTVALEDDMMSRLEKYGKTLDKLTDLDRQKIFLQKSLDETYRKSVENKYFQSLADIILSPVSFERLMSPNNVDEFTSTNGHLDNVNKIKGIQSEDKVYNPAQMLDEQYMIRSRNIFLKAKQQVGISAVSGSNTSNFQKIPTYLIPKAPSPNLPNFVWDDAPGNDYLRFNHNTISLGEDLTYATLSRVKKSDGSNILRYKSKYTNGAVDVTKNDWLVRFGASEQAFAVAVLAEGLGYNTDDIGLMINHPLVKEYIRIKALKGASVYEQNEDLKKAYGSLLSDSNYVEYFLEDLSIQNKFVIPNRYAERDKTLIKQHIAAAGGEHLYSQFKDAVMKDDYSKELAITVLQEFLRLKQNGTDLRMNIDASNHETVNLNSNYISKLKDSKANLADKKTIKSIIVNRVEDTVKTTYSSLAKGLRQFGVANRLADNLGKAESFLYKDVFFSNYETLVDRIVKSLTNDDDREVFLKDARDQAEQFESQFITSTLHSTRIPETFEGFEGITSENINNVFQISDDPDSVYQYIIKQKELNQTRTPNRKVKEGTYVLDYISLRPITEESEYFYLQVNNKPSQSDIFASNQFFESIRNLKTRNPKIYSTLMLASILQSGNNFDRNNIISYMLHEDYLQFSKALNDIVVDEDFFRKLSRVFVQNNYKKDNGVTTKVEGKLAVPFVIDSNKPRFEELKNNRIRTTEYGNKASGETQPVEQLVFQTDTKGRLSQLLIFPKKGWGPVPRGKTKGGKMQFENVEKWNKFVQRPYLTGKAKMEKVFTAENGDVIRTTVPYEFLLERVPIDIMVNDVEYTVYQHLPAKGTNKHLESNLNKINSEFNTNQKVDYKTPQEIRQSLEFLYGAEAVIDRTQFEEQVYQDVTVAPPKVKKVAKGKAKKEAAPKKTKVVGGKKKAETENKDGFKIFNKAKITEEWKTPLGEYGFRIIAGNSQDWRDNVMDIKKSPNSTVWQEITMGLPVRSKEYLIDKIGQDTFDYIESTANQETPTPDITDTQEGRDFVAKTMGGAGYVAEEQDHTIVKGPEEGMPDIDICEEAPF